MALSTYLRQNVLNHFFRTPELDKLGFLYAALYTSDPTPANTGTEVDTVDTGYARQVITVADASWSAPADAAGYMSSHNLVPITWAAATDDLGTPSHWGLLDAVTGGNLWVYGPIQGTLRSITTGDDPISFEPEALEISVGQAASDYVEAGLLNHMLRTATLAKPANIYASLHTEDPTDAGGVGEFTGTNYARVPIAVADASWTAPAAFGDSQSIVNLVTIEFPTPGSEWGVYAYSGLSDAASGGNLLYKAPNDSPQLVGASDRAPTWLSGAMRATWS